MNRPFLSLSHFLMAIAGLQESFFFFHIGLILGTSYWTLSLLFQ